MNKSNQKVVVLLSGGIDSSTCVAIAVDKFGSENVYALNILYGQKHDRELKSAQDIANHYNIHYQLLDLSSIFSFSNCSLLKHSTNEITHKSYFEQLSEIGGEGTVSTYVPFRNGLMLSTAASYAQSVGANIIYYGAHADDAAGRAYPDCTTEFVEYMNKAIYIGTGNEVSIEAPFINYNKTEIVKLGLELKVPYEKTWSCYEGDTEPCRSCGTCIDREKAFTNNGTTDPLLKNN